MVKVGSGFFRYEGLGSLGISCFKMKNELLLLLAIDPTGKHIRASTYIMWLINISFTNSYLVLTLLLPHMAYSIQERKSCIISIAYYTLNTMFSFSLRR